MVFEAPGPSDVHVWRTPHSGPGLQTPPKFNEKTIGEREKSENGTGTGKKGPKLWVVWRRGVRRTPAEEMKKNSKNLII